MAKLLIYISIPSINFGVRASELIVSVITLNLAEHAIIGFCKKRKKLKRTRKRNSGNFSLAWKEQFGIF